MPITIGSNLDSLRAIRRLSVASGELVNTYERLSSGLRINRASDDAAGLAIAESLNKDSRVFSQAVRNLNDGLSLLNIADSALEQFSLITVRIKELAAQAANGVYGVNQRKALDREAQQLSDEFFRLSRSTKFNGRLLFAGSAEGLRLQAGFGLDGGILSSLGGNIGTGAFGSKTTDLDTKEATTSVHIADVNRDGILDAISSGHDDGEI